LTGRLPELAGYRVLEARRIEIAVAGQPMQVDGGGTGRLRVEVLPGARSDFPPAPLRGASQAVEIGGPASCYS
jgi:hypothetical protein